MATTNTTSGTKQLQRTEQAVRNSDARIELQSAEMNMEMDASENKLAIALQNYECYHALPKGSATLDQQINQSFAGIDG